MAIRSIVGMVIDIAEIVRRHFLKHLMLIFFVVLGVNFFKELNEEIVRSSLSS
jgi:hypothetical protein